MFEQFKAKAEAVSAEVYRFATSSDALSFLADFLTREGVTDQPGQYAVMADCPFWKTVDRKVLEDMGGVHFDVTRELASQAKIGVSQMDWAIVDTGTLVQDATAVDKRLVSTMPTIHVAFIATDGLRPDMPTVLAEVSPQNSNYISFITGPSRTADIERVLTIGVHGPERLVIVFIDQLGGAN